MDTLKMYTSLLAKHQFKIRACVQQKQLFSTCLKFYGNTISSYSIINHSPASKQCLRRNLTNIAAQLYNQRFYSHNSQHLDNQMRSLDSVNEDTNSIITEEDLLFTKNFISKQLYTEEDAIMKQLNVTESSVAIKNILKTEKSNLQHEHIVQSIIILWIFNRQNTYTYQPNNINDEDVIDYILSLLQDNVPKLNIDELSTCYLYLRKMGVKNRDPVLQQLLINALDKVEGTEHIIGLPALSRLVVGINVERDFCTPMVCCNFLRHLQHHIELCQKEHDARMIAICLYNLQVVINDELIELFKKKVSDLLASKEISSNTPKTTIKILNLLNINRWSHQHLPLIRKLMLTLETCIKQLNESELTNVSRIYQYHLEPISLHKPLAEALEESQSNRMTPEILACFIHYAQPQLRDTLINAFKALISSPESWRLPNSTADLFIALRGLKISDTKICNAFWSGVLTQIKTNREEKAELRFLRHCHRYMNFNKNLGGTYRHIELEKALSKMCMKATEFDLAGRIPEKFARLASFVLAYGHTSHSWAKYPNILLSKIITMGEQFTPTDCYIISRGLQISLQLRYRIKMPQLVRMQLSTIDSILNACLERHLNNDELNVTDLNMLVRTLSHRKSFKNTTVYHKILQKYKAIQCQDLNSRLIKDMTYNFTAVNYLVPEILEKILSYIEDNCQHVKGEIVEKVLSCIYSLGYTPQYTDTLHYAGEILLRDFNYMSGLSVIKACLALCFYKTIPEELINKVFCVNFIQRVEEEIQSCYSTATYPKRVLNIVMQLNRSVCLDFPEANIPWFQQNFIEAQISKKHIFETGFSRDVKSLLTDLLKNESYIRCNHTTPYGYQIDFVINFDKNKKPIEAAVETTMLDRITKVAILLLKINSFCENDLNALRGLDSLKIRHLEMMGYKVLHIKEHDWNSKYMNVPGAKQNYLKCLLQISS